ncbi:MAG: PSD1 and planctomycete cytochrome C domain-containing protein [Chthoniobacter sp.]|nr:PSD1 and planctomycete cytochrome C domain-containing protein [Chthoniobacter sp.]
MNVTCSLFRRWRLALPFAAAFTFAPRVLPAAVSDKVDFNRQIRPILSDNCFACHGLDAKKRKAKLRLDTPEGAYALNEEGIAAIVPGDADRSDAWGRIVSEDKDELMPPPDSHKPPLTAEQKALIKRWIEEGAKYQRHWAFEPQAMQEPPKPANAAGLKNPIDAFIRARLEREGVACQPEADRGTLVRRVSFALTGLPPTPQEVAQFAADQSADAYEKMVDRYLASPRYGEEMARHWLDVARYADTHGLHFDNERQMWAYRDWVIKAFNTNEHFDQFTIDQLAGDLLPNATQDQLIATGFNRCNVTTSEGGSIDAEFIFRYAVDRTSTMVGAWMGLTGGCAVCHDHKFDPLTMKDFYSMYSFFQSGADPVMDGNALLTKPVMKIATPEQQAKLKEFADKLCTMQQQIDEKVAGIAYTDPATAQPPPPVEERESVWVDDDFPAGAKVKTATGNLPLMWVTAENGQVAKGKRAIKRSEKALGQDYYQDGAAPLAVPVDARIFFHVFLDPSDPPEEIMIQFHTGEWRHRAVWGKGDLIPFGTPGTTEHFVAGPLPDTSKWVRLEVEAEKIGLKAGDRITGIAFTLHGGTAYFDQMGVNGRSDPAADPAQSFLAWQKQAVGKDTQGVPPEINRLLKEGPDKARTAAQEKDLRTYYLQNVCAHTRSGLEPLVCERDALKKQRDTFEAGTPSTFIWRDLDKPHEAFVMLRGQYDKPGDKVMPGTPAIFPPLKKADENARATRLDLAKWLVSAEHPLTARVTVNRFWQQFFGTGLVKSSGDFGSQGEMPSHPELLDWLSVTFRESCWDVKALVRLFVTSATFRQATNAPAELWKRDPENRLLARGPRVRLDAEQLRDNALAVSGLINLDMGGKGVRPYQPPNIWEPVGFLGSNTRFYKADTGVALYRRSIYTFLKRSAPPPFMANFDAPNRENICVRRERSNTPLQALQLMNDEQHIEAARALAERMIAQGGTSPQERVQFAFRAVLARDAGADEMKTVLAELDAHRALFAQDAESAKKTIAHGASKPDCNVPAVDLASYTMVANMILNLDETLNRN